MKIQLKRITVLSIMFVLLCTFQLSAYEIIRREQKPKKINNNKAKLFVGFNYENYRTSFYSAPKQENFEELSTLLNEGLSRLHLRLTAPINSSNIILDFKIPFMTQDNVINSMAIDNTMYTVHKKFNVFEFDVGIEFEF